MRNRKALVLWIALVGLAGMAQAQEGAAGAAQREQVKTPHPPPPPPPAPPPPPRGQGPRETFQATETVQPRLDGMILVFEGLGKDSSGKVGHNAYAVLSWDQAAQRYRFLAFRADGIVVDTAPVMGDKTMQWGFEIPQGKLRFTLDFSKPGEWFETGEWSRDGQQWVKFMEMKLKRV